MIRVGISGWSYPPWRRTFYPPGLPQRLELHYASRQLNSIELNGSFYSLQRPESYAAWYADTPEDFVFAVKGGRFITHLKRLKEIEAPLANFFASGLLNLREKLGPILWQFPPMFAFDRERFARFLELLPHDTVAAARLAGRHDRRVAGRAVTETDARRPLRHAFEIRHESFLNDEFFQLLRNHGAALVIADTASKWPYVEELTTDFVYVRLHGEKELYASGYDELSLRRWARQLRRWTQDAQKRRDAYVYFDNDVKVRAPFDAISLAAKLTDFKPEAPVVWHGEPASKRRFEPVRGLLRQADRRWPGFRKREGR